MPGDPYYRSAEWLAVRGEALERDRYTCTVAGCGEPACVVDHILSRRRGGTDDKTNLRSLCRGHDNQLKEKQNGERRSGGVPFIRGCDEQGRSADPNHPWNRERPPTASPAPANRLLQLFGQGGG